MLRLHVKQGATWLWASSAMPGGGVSGKDVIADGTVERPFPTVQAALAKVAAIGSGAGVEILVHDGVYIHTTAELARENPELTKTHPGQWHNHEGLFRLLKAHSGSLDNPLVIRAANPGKAVFAAAVQLKPGEGPADPGLFKASTAKLNGATFSTWVAPFILDGVTAFGGDAPSHVIIHGLRFTGAVEFTELARSHPTARWSVGSGPKLGPGGQVTHPELPPTDLTKGGWVSALHSGAFLGDGSHDITLCDCVFDHLGTSPRSRRRRRHRRRHRPRRRPRSRSRHRAPLPKSPVQGPTMSPRH